MRRASQPRPYSPAKRSLSPTNSPSMLMASSLRICLKSRRCQTDACCSRGRAVIPPSMGTATVLRRGLVRCHLMEALLSAMISRSTPISLLNNCLRNSWSLQAGNCYSLGRAMIQGSTETYTASPPVLARCRPTAALFSLVSLPSTLMAWVISITRRSPSSRMGGCCSLGTAAIPPSMATSLASQHASARSRLMAASLLPMSLPSMPIA